MKTRGDASKKNSNDSAAVLARVTESVDLPRTVASNIRNQLAIPIDVSELESMGRVGLIQAARTYEADRGVPFRSWAYLKIRGAILDALRREATLPHRAYRLLRALQAANETRAGQIEDDAAAASETAESANMRVSDATSTMAMAMAAALLGARHGVEALADEKRSPEDLTIEKLLMDKVRASIDRLPKTEQSLLKQHYFEDVTLDDASKRLGLSKSWGSRLHARALAAVVLDVRAGESGNEE